jgi:hypothetical protein
LHVDNGPQQNGQLETANYEPYEADGTTIGRAYWRSFTGYKCRNRGLLKPLLLSPLLHLVAYAILVMSIGAWFRGARLSLVNARFADSAIGSTLAMNGGLGEVIDAVFIGETNNKGSPEAWETKGLDGRSLPLPWAANHPIRG